MYALYTLVLYYVRDGDDIYGQCFFLLVFGSFLPRFPVSQVGLSCESAGGTRAHGEVEIVRVVW